jgi:hypothetical protein
VLISDSADEPSVDNIVMLSNQQCAVLCPFWMSAVRLLLFDNKNHCDHDLQDAVSHAVFSITPMHHQQQVSRSHEQSNK